MENSSWRHPKKGKLVSILTIAIGVLPRPLEENIPEVRQSGLEFKGLLGLLNHVQPFAPAVRRVQLTQIRCEEHVGLDARGVDADDPGALGVDAEHINGELLDGSMHCLGVQAVQRRALGILFRVKVENTE